MAATVYQQLNKQIRDNNLLFRPGDIMGRIALIEIRGKISFAYELGLISYSEWQKLIDKAFVTINSGE